MKTNKLIGVFFLTGLFFLAFASFNSADAQRSKPIARIENKRDRKEDIRDRREDARDKKEDKKERKEDIRYARHHGGNLDRREDIRDRREDARDRKEDKKDRRYTGPRGKDRRDRRF